MANKDKQLIQAEEVTTAKKVYLTLPEELGLKPALVQKQILHIMQKTPKAHVYKRPAKGGGQWDYVTGTYVEKVLNYVFGWDWSFEVKDKGREGNLVWVLGRLSCVAGNGSVITKEQFGRADIKKNKAGGDLDYGNDLKAAATDSLKKCASLLGIASDIYGKEEFKEISIPDSQLDDSSEPATQSQIEAMNNLSLEYSDNITKGEAAQKIAQAYGKK